MSALAAQAAQVLGPDGVLAQAWPGYRGRSGQQAMAAAVCAAIEEGGALVVEAGTGVGKTFAYLVPVLLSGQRALISTATKALQDQLFARDLPRLAQALGVPVRVALLKGRGSYVCLHRLEQARHQSVAQAPSAQATLAQVERWTQVTRTGDLAEVPGLDEASPLWPWLRSTRDNCLGSACPRYKACHVMLARREAMAADVVVINHHLFFADLAVRESGVAELLPTVRVTVFDEAHQLCQTGVQFLGQELSSQRLLEFKRDLEVCGLQWARGLADWSALAQTLETATRDWRLILGPAPAHRGVRRATWSADGPTGVDLQAWAQALQGIETALSAVHEALQTVSELSPDFVRLIQRGEAQTQLCQRLRGPAPEGAVRWLEWSQGVRAVEAPLDVANTFRPLTSGRPANEVPWPDTPTMEPPAAAGTPEPRRAWIFTSATLGHDPSLSWFTQPCGLEHARVLCVDSPFDYPRQAAWYVPEPMPACGTPEHALAVADWVRDAALQLGGRVLVLATTLQAMRSIAQALEASVGDRLAVLVQGQGPKHRLMERFRAGGQAGQPGCVLVGSASFWEGVDVPGQALQMVVIDKLPFSPPDDPLLQARAERLERQGKSPFAHLALPEAAVTLKQGAGRLIRSESDQGLLVVCDPRLLHSRYSRRLQSALPPMRQLHNAAQYQAALQALSQGLPLPPLTTAATRAWPDGLAEGG